MLAGCSSSSVHFPMKHRDWTYPAAAVASPARKHLHLEEASHSTTTTTNRLSARPVDVRLNRALKLPPLATSGCSIKQSIKLPPLTTTRGIAEGFSCIHDNNNRVKKSLKRLAEENKDESCLSRVKRKRGETTEEDHNRGFWFEHSSPAFPFSLTCSGDDKEKIWFVPSEVISQPLHSKPNWVNSVQARPNGLELKSEV
ncbi:hypothetical protein Bca4012_043658 [Brassica carinata]